MVKDGLIYCAKTDDGREISIIPKMANRHGLIAGATGTGKTISLKVLAESFSDMGVPVFLADVKGDLAGMIAPGTDSEDMQARISRFGLADTDFHYHAYPVTFFDVYGQKGLQLRTTITEMGPLLLSRILGLNDTQTQIMTVVFKIADENNLLLDDTKDLKAMLSYVRTNAKSYRDTYGNISGASIDVMLRAVTSLEMDGGDVFFGEPALNIFDWITRDSDGRGMINILDSESLINHPSLYSTFLLWMLSELFELLPEVGDQDKPKLVFFFDEAHLLFKGASKLLLEKIEQVVKLVRSKGVGIYFITQNPQDIPDGVLAQLGNKIEHSLHAYTPSERKAVKAAAESFRDNPDFDTYEAIQNLGTGEAVVSFLDEKGTPGVSQLVKILPPQSRMGSITDAEREQSIKGALLYTKYAQAVDRDSAYEFLKRKGLEDEAEAQKAAEEAEAAKQKEAEEKAAAKQAEKEAAAAEKQAAKEAAAAEKAAEKEKQKAKTATKKAAKSVASSVTGTIGREAGKALGSNFGSFGKTLGGNLGASLGRGIIGTLFKL